MDFMTKHNKLIAAFLLIAFVFGMVPAAFAADSSIEYVNGAEKFVFVPSNNLFDNFKGVMPGDTIEQKITVKNGSNKMVKIFLRAVANENTVMQGFLQQLSMTVKQGDKTLFDASPDKLDGLAENVLLGQFAPDASTELSVILQVPITLDNTYANCVGEVDWVFTVEEVYIPSDTDDGIIPNEAYILGKVPDAFNGIDHFAYIFGYPDGTVKPHRNITRAEVATILYRLLKDEVRAQYQTDQCSFSDVAADAWYSTNIATMEAMGAVAGYPDGTFRPNNPITRAEYTAILSRFADLTVPQEESFTDIDGHWAENAIRASQETGWVAGYEDGTFRPDNCITRAEAIAITNRVLCRQPETLDDLHHGMVRWPDNADTGAWYYMTIQEASDGHDYDRKANGYESWTALEDDNRQTSLLDRLLQLLQ